MQIKSASQMSVIGVMWLSMTAHGLTLKEISDYLLDEQLVATSPQQIMANENILAEKFVIMMENDEELLLQANRQPNTLDASFLKLSDQWMFNDASFNYYSGKVENCQKQQNAYKKYLTKKLNHPTLEDSEEEFFWQLPDRDWGIWLTVTVADNPFSQNNGCVSKMTLIYSPFAAQNDGEDI